MGPFKQLKKMFESTRLLATIIMLGEVTEAQTSCLSLARRCPSMGEDTPGASECRVLIAFGACCTAGRGVGAWLHALVTATPAEAAMCASSSFCEDALTALSSPGVLRAHAVCCSVVAQEGAGPALLHPAVPVHDLVQPIVHPVCKGRRHEVLLLPPGLRTDRDPPVEWPLVWCFLSRRPPSRRAVSTGTAAE
nr:SFT2 domain containing 1 [Pipistrellus kuhlii]